MAEDDAHRGAFTRRLRQLFRTVLDPETGRTYSYAEAARRINARVSTLPEEDRAGRTISTTYVWQLVEGRRDNPTMRHMESLAELFGVPISFLVGDDPERAVEVDLRVAAAMRDAGVSRLAHRARGLSPGAIDSVLSMIEHVRRLEGLAGEE